MDGMELPWFMYVFIAFVVSMAFLIFAFGIFRLCKVFCGRYYEQKRQNVRSARVRHARVRRRDVESGDTQSPSAPGWNLPPSYDHVMLSSGNDSCGGDTGGGGGHTACASRGDTGGCDSGG